MTLQLSPSSPTRLSLFVLLAVLFTAMLPDAASAQGLRPEETLYIKPRVGIAFHLGDTEMSPFNFNMDNWKVGVPYAAGVELGYQFSQSTSLSLGWQLANHPLIFHYGDHGGADSETFRGRVEDDETASHAFQLLFRIAGQGRVAPFLALGGHVTTGSGCSAVTPALCSSLTFGPAVGAGLDIVLSDRTSLVLDWISDLTFPDDGLDGQADNIFGDSFLPFDLSNSVTLGLKFNFKSAFTPVEVLSLDCPSTLRAGETGTFTARVNADATQPVDYGWRFGDGGTATGATVSHSYAESGTYDVTVTASNPRSTNSRSCSVTVTSPAEIVSMTANPMTFDVCAPRTVNFSANVRGTTPVEYRWDFGDGSTGTGASPSHTYTEPGTYTVTLTASNAAGTDSRSLTLTAEECRAGICFEITEMNSVFFANNSSTLSDEARAALQENLEILRECPNLCVRIEAFAAPGERNPQQLSEDRARAVAQYYMDNGVAASRIVTVGRGRVEGVTSKKEGAAGHRRADTIPVQCVDLR